MFIPRWICICVPNLVLISPAVWQISHIFNLWPPKTPQIPPCVTRGKFLFCPLPFVGESACVCQIWSQSDHRRRRVYAWKDTHTHTHTHTHTLLYRYRWRQRNTPVCCKNTDRGTAVKLTTTGKEASEWEGGDTIRLGTCNIGSLPDD